ncbi:MAG TPA: FecR domain-containing protein [Acidobacteriota bacterium]|nr:FecR domain-containing protein [Acidobacteriota bacterium]
MTSKDRNILNETIQEIRDEQLDAARVQEAAARVWNHVRQELTDRPEEVPAGDKYVTAESGPRIVEKISNCSDFQSLIPAYLSGALNPSRALLLEDHTRECISCRRALRAARQGVASPVVDASARNAAAGDFQRIIWRWGIAAAILIGIVLTQLDKLQWLLPLPAETRAIAQTVDGTLFRVAGWNAQAMTAGDKIGQREAVRTAMNSRAVIRLADGSRVEMRERSELSLEAARDGTTVRLGRGSVIVEAARQRDGHLYVATPDCLVSVTGTVFSVNKGAKGSRVSVIEGEVAVQQGKTRQVLRPGEQLATHSSLAAVPVEQEIAWSRNVDAHIALLRELKNVSRELAGKLSGPALRYDSRLLPLVPEDTVIYAAFPNISETLGHAFDIFRQRVSENPDLQQWWKQQARSGGNKPDLEEMIARIRRLGSFLGDEIVIAVPKSGDRYDPPVLLAEVRRPAELVAALEDDAARLNSGSEHGPVLRVVHNEEALNGQQSAVIGRQSAVGSRRLRAPASEPGASATGPAGVSAVISDRSSNPRLIFVGNDILASSSSAEELQRLLMVKNGSAGNKFLGTGFHSRIRSAYQEGAGWLFAADMERILKDTPQSRRRQDDRFAHYLGIPDVQQVVVEQKSVAGQTENRAIVNFSGTRQGLAGWLAEPAPMGALDFVSPEALGVAAFAVRNPASLVDELFALLQNTDLRAWQNVLEFQKEHGVDIRGDIAAPLGGEFLFAVDGPLLPNPSWKIVVEVYDAARLQNTLQWAVAQINQEAAKDGKPGLMLTQEYFNGKTFYRLASEESGYEADYVFHNGYLVMAPSRTLVIQALQYRDTGYTLGSSAAFKSLLPVDGRAHCSALFYHNVAPVVGSLAQHLPQSESKLTPDQTKSLQEIAAQTPPTLICIYAEKDRIIVAAKGEFFDLGTLAGFGSLGDLLSKGKILQRKK